MSALANLLRTTRTAAEESATLLGDNAPITNVLRSVYHDIASVLRTVDPSSPALPENGLAEWEALLLAGTPAGDRAFSETCCHSQH